MTERLGKRRKSYGWHGFRNVSRLFADPDWDGQIEMDGDFNPKSGSGKILQPPVGPGPDPVDQSWPKPIVNRDGCRWKLSIRLYPFMAQMENCFVQKALSTTRRKYSGCTASLDNFTSKMVGRRKERKNQGTFAWTGLILKLIEGRSECQMLMILTLYVMLRR